MNIEDRIYLYNHLSNMVTDLIRKQFDFNNGDIPLGDMMEIVRRKCKDMFEIIDGM